MPRKSYRLKAIDVVKIQLARLRREYLLREIHDEEDSLEDERYFEKKKTLNNMIHTRYLFRKAKYRKDRKKFDMDDALSSNSHNFNDEEFLAAFRITRDSFFLLLEEMKTKKAFRNKSRKKQPRPIAYQLLVFLFRIGNEGSAGGSHRVSQFFGIAKGSVTNYVRRCVLALLEMKDDIVNWPDENERDEMRKRLSAYGFWHCVGIIDGTLIELAFRPQSYHECYFSRKCMYALNVMIICDDKKRVTYYNAGWPGSTHDNRVFRNSKLFYNRERYFSQKEYLLGDSAYSASPIMVQSFKKQAAVADLPPNHEFFNTCLAQVRIASEHCIGILKGRFQCLKKKQYQIEK